MQTPAYPSILVLGRDTCEDTVASRAHLDARGIAYTYGNIELVVLYVRQAPGTVVNGYTQSIGQVAGSVRAVV